MRSATTRQQNMILPAFRESATAASRPASQPSSQPASSMSEIECSYRKPILTYHLLHEGFFSSFFFFFLNSNF
jgi:hypothetical protein